MMSMPYLRFQISGQGWPINGGAMLIPAGAIIDYSIRDTWGAACWSQQLLPPINATPLDMVTWQFMQNLYKDHAYLLGPPPS
jgi:hypothetical protein